MLSWQPRFAKPLTLFILLIVAGYLGNRFYLPLFFGVDFLFGSIATMLAVQWMSPVWAIPLAVIVGSFTEQAGDASYAAMVVAAAEAAVVTWQFRCQQRRIAFASGIYWFFLGIPLVWLAYSNLFAAPFETALAIALKQASNGLFNAFVADLLGQFLPLGRWLRLSATPQQPRSIQHGTFNTLLAIAFLPTLVLTIFNGWQLMQVTELESQERLLAQGTALERSVRVWFADRQHEIAQLAVATDEGGREGPELLQTLVGLEPLDRTFAALQFVSASGSATAIASGGLSSLPPPDCEGPAAEPKLLASAGGDVGIAFTAAGAEGSWLCGWVPLQELVALLRDNTEIWGTEALLLDASGQVAVASATVGQQVPFDPLRGGQRRPFGNGEGFAWLPDASGTPLSIRWRRGAFYGREFSLGNSGLPWQTLLLRQPLSPSIDALEAFYSRNLALLLAIWGLSLLTAGYLSRHLVAPLRQLTHLTDDLPKQLTQGGELPPWPRSQVAEVATLSRTFQEMSRLLQAQFARVREVNASLEERVCARTAELSAGEERLRLLTDALPVGIAYIDAQGYCHFANRTYRDRFGLAVPTEGLLRDILGTEAFGEFEPYIARALQGKPVEFETRLGERPTQVILAPDLDGGGTAKGCYLLQTDISPRKQAEVEAARARNFLQTILDRMPVAIFVKDGRPESFGQYLLWNRASEALFGIPTEAAIGRVDADLFASARATEAAKRDRDIFAAKVPADISCETVESECLGERQLHIVKAPLYDEEGQPQYLLCFAEDITPRLEAEAALRESERRFGSLVGATTDALLVVDASGRICFHNPAAERLFGRSTMELESYVFDRVIPAAAEAFTEIEIARPDGQLAFAQMRVVAIEWEGQPAYLASLTDVTQRHRAEVALRQREANYRDLIDHLDAGVVVYTPDTRIALCNAKACELLGLSVAELIGKSLEDLPQRWCREDGSELPLPEYPVSQVLRKQVPLRQSVFGIRREEGGCTWVLANGFPEFSRDRALQQVVVTFTDINNLKQAETQLRHAALHDELTGLANRALLVEHLDRALGRIHRYAGYWFAVLFIDLDRFKTINDSLGHQVGDLLLLEVARRLESIVRTTDTVCRLGGDEFVILLDGICDAREVSHVANRIQDSLRSLRQLDGREISTSASIGVALGQESYGEADEVLRDADTAMYRAKARGGACSEIFDRAMHEQVLERFQLETSLRRALERDEFELHYQPIIALGDRSVVGFEALVRWHHPEKGPISPAKFIPVAEEAGSIFALGAWVLETACLQAQRWLRRWPDRPLEMCVNVSARQLQAPNFLATIDRILARTDLSPERLKLELTESTLLRDVRLTVDTLAALRERNVRVSIDDFGTGYSSLSYLKRFPVNTLKIDRSFIADLGTQAADNRIVEAIVTLARTFGLDVVAEGVETELQLQQLEALQCQAVQGYLLSRPLATSAAEDFLAQRGPVSGLRQSR